MQTFTLPRSEKDAKSVVERWFVAVLGCPMANGLKTKWNNTVLDGNSDARRVLIVEDEPLLALNIEDMLTELGHHVVATATRIDKSLSLAQVTEFDLAVLDINLAGSNTFQVADILRKRGLPFIFTTGYGADGYADGSIPA
jgi:hypothetical protein